MNEVKSAGMFTELLEFYKKMFDFKGRARRREYWVSYMWNIAIMVVLLAILYPSLFSCIDMNDGTFEFNIVGGILGILSLIALIVFSIVFEIGSIAISIRRCHDIGKSGWYLLWCCLGCFCCGKDTNEWGENPKSEALNKYDNSKGIVASIIACVLSYVFLFIMIFAAVILAMI